MPNKKVYDALKSKGVCARCACHKAEIGTICMDCLLYLSKYDTERKQALAKSGKCIECGVRVRTLHSRCVICRAANAERVRKFRARASV